MTKKKRASMIKPTNVKIGDIVKSHHKGKGYYCKVFAVNNIKGSWHTPAHTMVTVAVFCLADGRPTKMRRDYDQTWLEVVDGPPQRFFDLGGHIPHDIPGESIPGGTPPRKFTDSFKVGDTVAITRTRHGWMDGMWSGTITQLTEFTCMVRVENQGEPYWEVEIEKPRDIHLTYR